MRVGRAGALSGCLWATLATGCFFDLHFYTDGGGGGGSGGAGGTGTGTATVSSTATATVSSTATATASSTGAGGGCSPGSVAPCYGGPDGTEGQGICKAGSKTCAPDGMTYGPCTGDVTPKPEDCATPIDEDCDGLAPPCKGTPLWSVRAGDANAQSGDSIAVDAAGNVLVTGFFSGSIDFGGGALQSMGSPDVFIAKLDAGGSAVWNKRAGGIGVHYSQSIAVDGAGNVLVSGYFTSTIDLGGSALQSAGASDVFIAKLDAGGSLVWSKRAGDSNLQSSAHIAVDSAGNVLVVGGFRGSMDWGGCPVTSAGNTDLYVAKLDPSGACLWSKRAGDTDTQGGAGVAVDAGGNVLVTGSFGGSMDLGGCPVTSAGNTDLYVAKLDPSGACLWSKRAGDAGAQYGLGVAVDGMGHVMVTGGFSGFADFGGGSLASAGGEDVFVVKLDAAGNHLWSRRAGSASDDEGHAVAVDASGNTLVTGYFSGSADFGPNALVSAGSDDMFIAKFAP
jgi:hypothetical protein